MKTDYKKLCAKLWADIIKKRAGYKSEYSGKLGKEAGGTEILNAHHIAGKPNNRLRYELSNGICITNGEHFYIAHHSGRQESFRDFVKKLRGEDIYDKLKALSHTASKSNLKLTYIYLKQEFDKLG